MHFEVPGIPLFKAKLTKKISGYINLSSILYLKISVSTLIYHNFRQEFHYLWNQQLFAKPSQYTPILPIIIINTQHAVHCFLASFPGKLQSTFTKSQAIQALFLLNISAN